MSNSYSARSSIARAASPLALVLALGAVSVGCAHTGVNSPEGWNQVQTKHFTLYTSTSQLYSETLNGLEYHYATLSGGFFKADMGKVDVVFLESGDFVELFGTKRGSAALARVPGTQAVGKDGLLVVKESQSDDGSGEGLAHIFMHRSFPKAPLWYHEGFAAYVRSMQYREGNGQRMACFGKPQGDEFTVVPISKLISMSWDEYDGPEARGWFKHTGRTLFDFIFHAEGGKRIEAFNAVVTGVEAGQSGEEIFKAAFRDLDAAALEKRLGEHRTDVQREASTQAQVRGMCPIGFAIPADKAPDISERKLEDVPADKIRPLLEGLKRLPLRSDGYPSWYPEEIVARAESAGAAKQ
jgi:hypothetical protein